MIAKVVAAEHVQDYKIWLHFADGLEGEIDLENVLWGPAFEPLRDVVKFAQLRVDPEWHTITWPGDIDIAPESLHVRLKEALTKQDAAE